MEISSLSDLELEAGLQKLLGAETETLHDVLVHIREVDARKLYLRRAKPNLWAYLIKDFRLSAASAQLRIDAARLSNEIPDLLAKIRAGKLNLCKISVLQKGVRQKEKEKPVSTEQKREILLKLESCGPFGAEKIVASELGLKKIEQTKTKEQGDETWRVSFTLSKRGWELLLQAKDVLSHKIPSGDLPAVFEEVLSYFVEKKDLRTATSSGEVPPRQNPRRRKSKKTPHEAPIPPTLRAFIFARDRHCQWRHPETNELCGSTFLLEIDHIKMRSHGGTNDPENLRLLCAGHNQQEARDAGTSPPPER